MSYHIIISYDEQYRCLYKHHNIVRHNLIMGIGVSPLLALSNDIMLLIKIGNILKLGQYLLLLELMTSIFPLQTRFISFPRIIFMQTLNNRIVLFYKYCTNDIEHSHYSLGLSMRNTTA